MKLVVRIIFLLSLTSLLVTAQNMKSTSSNKAIDLDAQLDDVGTQGIAAQEKFYREWRARFQAETPIASLNAQDAADFRLIDDQIALNLLEFDSIQSYKHNPTGYVALIGNG